MFVIYKVQHKNYFHMTIFVRDECMAATRKTTQWRRQNFVPRGTGLAS